MSDHDRLDAVDAVHADDLGGRHHADRAGDRAGRRALLAEPPRRPRIRRAEHDQHGPAAARRIDGGGTGGLAITGDDEIDGPTHRAWRVGSRPGTRTTPLRLRKKASSLPSSAAVSRRGRSSLCPIGAAGARL